MSNLSTSVFKQARFFLALNLKYQRVKYFNICFCCIIRLINFDINVFSKISKRFRKVLTHFYTGEFHSMSFLSIQLSNESSYPFRLTYSLFPFLLITFSILNFYLIFFCAILFHKKFQQILHHLNH